MAKIIDFKKEQEKRFMEWVVEYIIIPENEHFGIDFLMAFLVANKVFTFDEIRAELIKRKICINENYFESAAMINESADLRQERNGE